MCLNNFMVSQYVGMVPACENARRQSRLIGELSKRIEALEAQREEPSKSFEFCRGCAIFTRPCSGCNTQTSRPGCYQENPQPIGKDRNGTDVFVGDCIHILDGSMCNQFYPITRKDNEKVVILSNIDHREYKFLPNQFILWKRGDTTG